jgi:hypothetical protein
VASIYATPTVDAIFAAWKKRGQTETRRRYLGASVIGKECARALWYDFRWAGQEDFDGRLYRVFDTGKREEPRIVADLRAIGVQVWEVDSETGLQFAYTACDGHFGGHADAVVLGLIESPTQPHLAEFKTHNSKSFADLLKRGLRESKPQHYAQMCVYMHLGEFDRGVYIAVNKDSDDIYIERIKEDARADGAKLIEFADRIIHAPTPPERIGATRDDYRCNFCCHQDRCWGVGPTEPAVPVEVNCRTCCHASPIAGGRWTCAHHAKELSFDEQLKGCEFHLFIPDFLVWAKVHDADAEANWIAYRYQGMHGIEKELVNTHLEGGFSSEELTRIPLPLLGDEVVDGLKAMGAKVVENDIDFQSLL